MRLCHARKGVYLYVYFKKFFLKYVFVQLLACEKRVEAFPEELQGGQ